MAHGLTGTRRDRLGAFAARFAAAGIAALLFDHRGFGDSTGEPDLFEPERQLNDWRAAIAFARSLPNVDPDRVATFGSSLGGGNALAAAADDLRVAAVISQVPFLDMSQAYTPDPRVSEEMEAAAAAGRYLPAVGQPHEAAFIHAPGAEVGWRRLVAIGEDSRWRNRCSAAWLLQSPYSVKHHAATLRCPWLVCVAANDQVAKPELAIEAAHQAQKGEVCIYPDIDHFDIYDGPPHEAVVGDEVAFLHRHLLMRSLVGVPKAASAVRGVQLPAKNLTNLPVMGKVQEQNDHVKNNKAIVTRWFTEFWAKRNPAIVDELGDENLVFSYPLHGELRGRDAVKKAFIHLVDAFPDISFQVVGDLIAEGDYVVGRWEGGGTHTGAAFGELPIGTLPPATGKRIHFSGTTTYRIENGKVTEEVGQEQALTVLQQLGLVSAEI
jgi:pimeloyl-ACP methyl ester carboxylesterase/predicted ester cyclase